MYLTLVLRLRMKLNIFVRHRVLKETESSHFSSLVSDVVPVVDIFANAAMTVINRNEAVQYRTCLLDALYPNPNLD